MHRPTFAALRPGIALGAIVAAAGCSSPAPQDGSLLDRLTPYRMEIVQGNVVTREQIALLRPGMTRAQVRDVVGSPLLTDLFHADRWDYVFTIRRIGAEPQRRAIVLRFEGEALKTIDAPELPSEQDFVASIDTFKSRRDAGPLALTEAQREALPLPASAPAPAPEPTGPAREYPPLESRP